MKKVYLFILFTILISGCKTTDVTTNLTANLAIIMDESAATVCDSIPSGETSVICELADKYGTSPAEVQKGLLLATNNAATFFKDYAQDAYDFVDEIASDLSAKIDTGKSLTALEVAEYTAQKIGVLPEGIKEIFTTASAFTIDLKSLDSSMVLSGYDLSLLQKHLAKQKAIISLYLN